MPGSETKNEPSVLSKFAAVASVCGLALSTAYIVFFAGGQTTTLNRHSDEIRDLQQSQLNHASREDIRRLEAKIDMIINNELQKQREARGK